MIRGIINDKRVFSMMRCKEIMFADSPYRFSSGGTLECLDRITRHTLFAFYQNMLQRSKVIITYIGRKVDLEQLTQKYFKEIFNGENLDLVFSDNYFTPAEVHSVAESYDVAQGKLCMGFRMTKPVDYFAARLFNVIFGGSPTSKLFMNVREKLSLCYYCSSMVDPYVHSMFISSGIEFENFGVAKDEILNQLEDMKKGNITEYEIETTKKTIENSLNSMNDEQSQVLDFNYTQILTGSNRTLEEIIENIKKVTIEDVTKIGSRIELDTIYFMTGNKEA
jgi:predicted Zn-dependent peptidase